jgi:hypothetical protein
MKLGFVYRRLRGWRSWLLASGAGLVFGVVPGCDPEVTNTLIKGLGETAIKVLEVKYWQTVNDATGSENLTPTVPSV